MNVHVFTDSLGHYMNRFVDRMSKFDKDALYVNLYSPENIDPKVYCMGSSIEKLEKKVLSIDSIERIFFHPLNGFHASMIESLKAKFKDLKIFYVVWSREAYVNRKTEESLLQPFALNFVRKKYGNSKPVFRNLKRLIKETYFNVFPLRDDYQRFCKAISQADFICCNFKEEYDLLRSLYNTEAQFCKFSYNDIDEIATNNLLKIGENVGEKVLLNHTADPSLNHFEILQKLEVIGADEVVMIPLSYGKEDYKKHLLSYAKSLNLNIEPIEKHLPYSDYLESLQQVKCAIFNTSIQQAYGNVLLLLWLGVKVFMRIESPLYRGFKREGFHIYCLEELKGKKDLVRLSLRQQKENQQLLKDHYKRQQNEAHYQDLAKL
ncbi:MAG: TDP-N-acetylfucosamine:lipid II N-acetylfucosaminyltransferase [Vicingaceae bacterium]